MHETFKDKLHFYVVFEPGPRKILWYRSWSQDPTRLAHF